MQTRHVCVTIGHVIKFNSVVTKHFWLQHGFLPFVYCYKTRQHGYWFIFSVFVARQHIINSTSLPYKTSQHGLSFWDYCQFDLLFVFVAKKDVINSAWLPQNTSTWFLFSVFVAAQHVINSTLLQNKTCQHGFSFWYYCKHFNLIYLSVFVAIEDVINSS